MYALDNSRSKEPNENRILKKKYQKRVSFYLSMLHTQTKTLEIDWDWEECQEALFLIMLFLSSLQ